MKKSVLLANDGEARLSIEDGTDVLGPDTVVLGPDTAVLGPDTAVITVVNGGGFSCVYITDENLDDIINKLQEFKRETFK